ncbi:hypothetical protein SCRM01_191 [Synechococcus phage S-CRM01]|uniref:hypothetical protein n=1 Tax=Synechococcus phage S-CRM01 TaxID=1026955 RepID=UPI000209E410|nr:hypothetical protein SCRM01_191 [Synechococcus phage S-CRM01]AEC53137.1 hypothetical protein SCRM01_191 [Synechococcus phage S-CRM01]
MKNFYSSYPYCDLVPFDVRLERQIDTEFRKKPTWSLWVFRRMLNQPDKYDSDVLNFLRPFVEEHKHFLEE